MLVLRYAANVSKATDSPVSALKWSWSIFHANEGIIILIYHGFLVKMSKLLV